MCSSEIMNDAFFSKFRSDSMCIGEVGKGRLGRPVRVTAKMTDFWFLILLVFFFFLKQCFAFSLYPSSVFRLEHILLLMTMFYLVSIFLITLSCID